MSDHTPGPWKVGKGSWVISENSEGINVSGGTGEEACKYYGGNLICESVGNSNAHLIAAAPDMLIVLKEIVKTIKDSDAWGRDCLDRGGFDLEISENLIARAEGKTDDFPFPVFTECVNCGSPKLYKFPGAELSTDMCIGCFRVCWIMLQEQQDDKDWKKLSNSDDTTSD